MLFSSEDAFSPVSLPSDPSSHELAVLCRVSLGPPALAHAAVPPSVPALGVPGAPSS